MINIIATEQIKCNNPLFPEMEKQWVFITLEVDGDLIEYTTVQPWNTKDPILTGQDLAVWCQSQEPRYKLEILKDMYPEAEQKTVKNLQDWIKSGAEITEKDGKKEKIVKKAWTNKHPKRIGLKAQIGEAKSINDLKSILLEMI